ncbi:MAG: chorismate-binding protein [Cyclobacteriaceae bacterium]
MSEKYTNQKIDLPEVDFQNQLQIFFQTAIKSNKPLAIWKMPLKDAVNAICQLDNSNNYPDELETAPPGFFFVPFDTNDEGKSNFIKADIILNSKNNELSIHPTFNNSDLIDDFRAQFTSIQNSGFGRLSDFLSKSIAKGKEKAEFERLVTESIDAINNGAYQKIVPSRIKSISLNDHFDPIKEFFKLCKEYTNAFISLVYVPSAGLWLGATPELLLSIEDKKTFRTAALAGTQSISRDFELARAAWTQKEIEEQALVSRYIINCFKSIRLREFDEYGPKTVKAGNLIHLKTEFTVDMEAVNYPLLGTAMLDLLHPTSAVCGMPMKPAAKFLSSKEGFDREYFSGYLGPSNMDDSTNLFVNLRCMRIYKNKGILFAGAGVTEDSIPENEWLETEMKFQTLLNVIN